MRLILLLLILTITPQPPGDPYYVAPAGVTQFQQAVGIGLLAHNTTPEGRAFAALKPGDIVTVTTKGKFQVVAVERWYICTNLYCNAQGERLTEAELSVRMYGGEYPLVLQTCIEHGGDYSWGRLFILAERYKAKTRAD